MDYDIDTYIKERDKITKCDIRPIKEQNAIDINVINEFKHRYNLDVNTFIIFTDNSKLPLAQSICAGIKMRVYLNNALYFLETIAISTASKIAEKFI